MPKPETFHTDAKKHEGTKSVFELGKKKISVRITPFLGGKPSTPIPKSLDFFCVFVVVEVVVATPYTFPHPLSLLPLQSY